MRHTEWMQYDNDIMITAQTHANTLQSTCMYNEGAWCLGNHAALHWSSRCAHQHQPANDVRAVYANAQKNHSEFIMGCVKFEGECECSSCVIVKLTYDEGKEQWTGNTAHAVVSVRVCENTRAFVQLPPAYILAQHEKRTSTCSFFQQSRIKKHCT